MDQITDYLVSKFDYDQSGLIEEDEYIDMLTYLDEDQSLTAEEESWARDQFEGEDTVASTIWLTDTISGAASGEGNM